MENIDWNKYAQLGQEIADGSRINCGVEHDFDGLSFDGWVDITAETREMEHSTIVKTIIKQETRYVVGINIVQRNYPSEPDDIEYQEVDDFGSIEEAIKKALLLVVENEIRYSIENIYEKKYLSDIKEAV